MTNAISAQTTVFNYQGKLTDSGAAANGTFQMQFKLFDSLAGGGQIGATLADVPVTATNGVFSVKLDFGANALSGANRWLEIAVRRNAGENYPTLARREQIASSPYAVRTLSAATADNALQLGGVPASEYVTNSTVGSSFIRNGTTPQIANLNISGNGIFGGFAGFRTGINPNFTVDSFGPIRAFSNTAAHFVAETTGGTNSWARFYMRSPNRSWFMGTSQNFSGDQLYLVDETAGQTRMAISTAGFVGFNNTNPQTGLDIRGTGLQVQQRITDNTSGNSLVLQAGSGGNTKITGFNYGTSTAVPLYLSVDGANTILNSGGGNVMQPGAGFGMPKAMVFVLANGTIGRCYNGISGATTNGCGFSANRDFTSFYQVNFGFDVSQRFVSLSTYGNSEAITGRIYNTGNNSVGIRSFYSNSAADVQSDFFLIVY